jgi:hypothetical protein
LQKAVKDRIPLNACSLEHVLWYHLECPDYAKKFDNPENQKWLKRQMYNILSVPYMNMRISEMNEKKQKKVEITDLKKKSEFVEYPEEIFESSEKSTGRQLTDLLKNKEFKEKFFEGVTYEKDPVEESE